MKAWTIAWCDTLIRLRDRNALVLMLVAPLILSWIMGAALGRFVSGDVTLVNRIRVLIVNDDKGRLGAELVGRIVSEDTNGLLSLSTGEDLAAARKAAEEGKVSVALYIPSDFTARLQSPADAPAGWTPKADQVGFYTDPAAPVQTQVVRNIASRACAGVSRTVADAVAGLEKVGATAQSGSIINEETRTALEGPADAVISLSSVERGGGIGTNPFAYFAPSMAIFFLMFTMFDTSRSLLLEQRQGTLGRLLRTPTGSSVILLGKLGGTYLTGLMQLAILVIASYCIFGLTWGRSPVALVLMVLALVIAASSLGGAVAALAKNPSQAEALSAGIAIIGAGIGGNFFPVDRLPSWFQVLSRLTINRWALEGFVKLTIDGGGLREVLPNISVLFCIGAALYLVTFLNFQKRLVR